MQFHVTNIKWDTDGCIETFHSLPQSLEISVTLEDDIADALSDAYGYCVFSFDCKSL